MMRCVEGEKEGAWKLAIDREVVHADCVWVRLRPTIDAEIVANKRMSESAPTPNVMKPRPRLFKIMAIGLVIYSYVL